MELTEQNLEVIKTCLLEFLSRSCLGGKVQTARQVPKTEKEVVDAATAVEFLLRQKRSGRNGI
jgi:hypothetical protein